ncbi:MAG TPA: DUF4337 domain-containing protein [Rhizomicrobium sp.]|nr:DUF4337 domain-containing protein [Rhizomicrobium sp.]
MALEIEAKTENKKLNSLVAITVVIVSVFLAISKLKDDNLLRGMAFVKADSVDIWNEYQSERIKLHNDENALAFLGVARGENPAALAAEKARLEAQMAKYAVQSRALAAKAQASDARYEAMNYRHDQFDVEDGVLSITLALTAVAALTEITWLLWTGWGFAGFGIVMGLAGIFSWPVHPEMLTKFLG